MIVDYDGRIVAQADPGPGEKIVVGPVDVSAVRHERAARQGHHMLAHLRTETFPVYRDGRFPAERCGTDGEIDVAGTQALIEQAKRRAHRAQGS